MNDRKGDDLFVYNEACSECGTTVFYTNWLLRCPICQDREDRKANAKRTGMMHEYHGYSREKL